MGGPWEVLLYVGVCVAALFYIAAKVFGRGVSADAHGRRERADERDGVADWLRANAADNRRLAAGADMLTVREQLESAAVALESAADMMTERTRQLRGE